MGVDIADCRTVAGLIGTKTFLNEFIAYEELGVLIGNKARLNAHVAGNGTWYYQGDDIILASPAGNTTTLPNGIISVRATWCQYFFNKHTKALCLLPLTI